MSVPAIPFQIVTLIRIAGAQRQETRNATTLPQAMEIAERELRKPHTKHAEVLLRIYCADRRNGETTPA